MRPPTLSSSIALLATAVCVTAPAAPASAKGLVGLSVCGAHGCVDRTALLRDVHGHDEDPGGVLDAGTMVADPGPARFVRLKLHIGEPGTHRSFGASTLIYLKGSGLVHLDDGTWRRPGPAAATLYKRAARHVAALPARALPAFEPPPAVPEAPPWHAPKPAHATADAGGAPAGLLAGAAGLAVALAAAAAFVLTRRGRPATG